MNLPNKLTMLRILLVPVFMVLAANRWMLAAGIVFAAASFTDFLDGYLARKNHLVTDFGKFADPLADKLLTTTAFVYMIVDGVCSPVDVYKRQQFPAPGHPAGRGVCQQQFGR